jgi:hypothetical protein
MDTTVPAHLDESDKFVTIKSTNPGERMSFETLSPWDE